MAVVLSRSIGRVGALTGTGVNSPPTVARDNATVTVGEGQTAGNTTNPLQFGGNTTQGYWFPGAMDDVRLYGSPLSVAAITDVMNGLSPLLPPGGLVTASPTLAITVESENDLVVLKWAAQAGRSYRVEYTDDLATGDWTALPGDVTVSGTTARTEDTLGLSTQRFYRVVVEP